MKQVIVPEEEGSRAFLEPNDDTAFPWVETEEGHVYPSLYPAHEGSTAVFTRPCLARAAHALAMRDQGVRTVAEVDDNYLSDPKHNIFMRLNGMNAEIRLEHLKATASYDANVFSTQWLLDEYWKVYKKTFRGAQLPEMHVCGNHVDDRDWPPRVEPNGRLRVGWMGSPSHVWDIDLAYYALRWASEAGHEVHLIGYDPGWPEGAGIDTRAGGKITTRSAEKIGQWRKFSYHHTAWTTPEKYHRQALPLDIGLCPLLTNKHTLGKSDVKFLEYAISGAATVAQANSVYNKTIVHGETGLLASSPEEFLRYTQLLCKDRSLRERLVANAQQYVREERSLQKRAGEWEEAIFGAEADLRGAAA